MDSDARSLQPKPSQDTFISMMQLDPTPIDPSARSDHIQSHPMSDLGPEELRRLEEGELQREKQGLQHIPTTRGSTSSVGLSGSGRSHGPVFFLMRIQRWSTYTFTIFTTFHLATTSLIPLAAASVPASESYLLLAREIYQTSLSEPLLVALPIIAHAASGLALRLIRRSQNIQRYGGATPGVAALHHVKTSSSASSHAHPSAWPPLSNIAASGYATAVFVWAHAFMNRGLPLLVEGDSANIGLAYVAHGFARHPVVATLAYGGLLAAACGHMVWGMAQWWGLAQRAGWFGGPVTGNKVIDTTRRKVRRRYWIGITSAAASFAGLWAAGGLGVVARGGFQEGWVGKAYDVLYTKIPGL